MNTVIVKNLDWCSFCLIYKPNGKNEGFYVKKTPLVRHFLIGGFTA